MKGLKVLGQKNWTAIGAKRLRELRQVESEIEKVEIQIASTSRACADWEKERPNVVAESVRLGTSAALTSKFAEANKAKLSSYREHETSLKARLADLKRPSRERTQQQDRLAQLALERYEKGAAIDSAIKAVRKAVAERAALTSEMRKIADGLGMSSTMTDTGIFERLLGSLPESVVTVESRKWLDRLTGHETRSETRTYVANRDLSLPESLTDTGVVSKGDEIDLTDKEAAEILHSYSPDGDTFVGFRYAITEVDGLRAGKPQPAFTDSAARTGVPRQREVYADPRQLPEYDSNGEKVFDSP
jgi:hypothetical protein